MTVANIALLGDYSDEVIAHRAIPKSIQLAATALAVECNADWIHTSNIDLQELKNYHGVWCVPASPYADTAKVLAAIKTVRENHIPFIGTCGGYQHATLEYAQNGLGYAEAGNAEEDPDTSLPLINAMFCALREKSGEIRINKQSRAFNIMGKDRIEEQYNCGFGVNAQYLSLFDNSDMHFTGFDLDNDPRILELDNHPFFIGTAFQPERSALADQTHPLIVEFIRAAYNASSSK